MQSMSRKGNGRDNAAIARFFGTLKKKKKKSFYQEGKLSVAELTAVIHDHHQEQISLNLKKLSPVAYGTQLEQTV